MSHRLEYYRNQPAVRLWRAITGYVFATTMLITSAVVLVPATYGCQARELGLLSDGHTIWSSSLPLTWKMAVAVALALLLTHEASEMGCESRLLTDIFHTLCGETSVEKESPRRRFIRGLAPYLGVLAGIPSACLAAYVLVLVIP